MSEEAKITEEQITKIASECQDSAEQGFMTQMKCMGMDDDECKKAHALYVKYQAKMAARHVAMEKAILNKDAGAGEPAGE